MKPMSILVLVAFGAMAVAGCSSSGGDESQRTLTDALTSNGNRVTISAQPTRDGRDVTLALTYEAGGDVRALTIRSNAVSDGVHAAPDGVALMQFVASMDAGFVSDVRRQIALDGAAGTDAQALRPIERAVFATSITSQPLPAGVHIDKSIFDCASYAGCYWGCALGGGGWEACGGTCGARTAGGGYTCS